MIKPCDNCDTHKETIKALSSVLGRIYAMDAFEGNQRSEYMQKIAEEVLRKYGFFDARADNTKSK